MARKRNRNRNKGKSKRVTDARVSSRSGADGEGDRTANRVVAAPTRSFYDLYALYVASWEARKIVSIVPADMTREGWKWESPENEESTDFTDDMKRAETDFNAVIEVNKALQYERLYGGGVVLMGTSDSDDTATPLRAEAINERNGLKFLRAIDRTRISSVTMENDITSAEYMRPKLYMINGHNVHRSRLLLFGLNGLEFPGFVGPTFSGHIDFLNMRDGFSIPIVHTLYDDIMRAIDTRQGASQLVEMASIMIINNAGNKSGTNYDRGTNISAEKREKLNDIANQMSIYRGVRLDNGDQASFLSANFGRLPELLIQFLQVLSAGSDIPATRFLGQAPGGLNATGESDLRNYYDSISANQPLILSPQLMKLGPILAASSGIQYPDDAEIEYNPLWSETDEQKAARQANQSTALAAAQLSGLFEDDELREEWRKVGIITTTATVDDDFDLLDIDEPTTPEPEPDGGNI